MKLGIMVGLPQSGKSTVADQLRNPYLWTVVCPDEVRLALHGHEFIAPAEKFVWATVELMTRALLNNGHDVLIDACNTTKKRRKPWLDMAKEYNVPLTAFVVDIEESTCLDRALANRKPNLIPVIERMSENWEKVDEVGVDVYASGWWDGKP